MRLAFVALLAIPACTRVNSYPVSSNPEQWGIECGRGQSVCVAEAQRLCPGGFRIVSNSGSASTSYLVQSGPYGTTATPMQSYSGQMIVECNAPDAAGHAPDFPATRQTD